MVLQSSASTDYQDIYHSIALKLIQNFKLLISGKNVEPQEMPGITGRSTGPWPHFKDNLTTCGEVNEIVPYSSETPFLGRSISYVHEYMCRKTHIDHRINH